MEFSMADFNATFQKTLDILLEEKKYSSAKDILSTMAPEDVAAVLQELDEKPAALLFRLLPKKIAAEAFVEMESDFQEKLIKGFSDKELTAILDEMYVNDAADIVEEMPANVVNRILFDDLMKTNVISVDTHTDQEEVVQIFSKYNFMALPVVDKEQNMVGIISFDDAIDVMEDETTEDIKSFDQKVSKFLKILTDF